MATYNSDPSVQYLSSELVEYDDYADLPTHACAGSDERYVLWSDIQEAFSGVDYVKEALGRLTFMIDDDDELYVSIFQRCNLVEPDGLLQKDGSSLLTFLLVHTVIISPRRCQPLRIQYAPCIYTCLQRTSNAS